MDFLDGGKFQYKAVRGDGLAAMDGGQSRFPIGPSPLQSYNPIGRAWHFPGRPGVKWYIAMTLKLTVHFCGWIVLANLVSTGCNSARNAIIPVIPASASARAAAMKSAPIIVIAEIQIAGLTSRQPKEVEKPEGIGGPMVPRIPLYLAKISAKPLLTVRGTQSKSIEFYSWVWASGKHGGPRLFHADPHSVHILFLKNDSGYLHTVCDYPNCDLQINPKWSGAFLETWRTGYGENLELAERLVAVRMKGELAVIQNDRSDYWRDMCDLVDFTNASFVAGQLDSLCQGLTNPTGRQVACSAYSEQLKNFR